MHRNSKTISKTKPEIRIIHIFAPEIIKTDATNFRELVQRLTGKPTEADPSSRGTTKMKARKKVARIFPATKKTEMAMSMRAGFHADFRERIKGEEEIWSSANSGAGFLGGFADFDGFMQEINHFPFLEGTTSHCLDLNLLH
ncbi:VQ motif-containing protein 25-like [Salvia divinorum]|uniref:VQ motif-containing protein 25-like n=1 Tax=Salvia divinorum TaxID=28513 RepID=A0ABD1HGI9_SALDI